MNVIIRTPEREYFNGPANSVSLRTDLGDLQILPQHMALQGTIVFSPIKILTGAHEEDFILQRGFVVIDQLKDEVGILVYECEKRADLSYKTAKEYMQFIFEALEKHESLNKYQILHLEKEKIAVSKLLEFLEREVHQT